VKIFLIGECGLWLRGFKSRDDHMLKLADGSDGARTGLEPLAQSCTSNLTER